MNSSLSRLLFVTGLLVLSHGAAVAQVNRVTKIWISSSWTGLGTPRHDDLTITRGSDGYYANGKKVAEPLVSNLLAVLNAPPVSEVDLANLNITQEWLNANAEAGVHEYADVYYSAAAPNLQ